VLNAMLYNVSTSDPFTYVAVALVLLSIVGVATAIPAAQASRIDPLSALRG
jgi:ABC-type lipoprotein release transport system permease subunit